MQSSRACSADFCQGVPSTTSVLALPLGLCGGPCLLGQGVCHANCRGPGVSVRIPGARSKLGATINKDLSTMLHSTLKLTLLLSALNGSASSTVEGQYMNDRGWKSSRDKKMCSMTVQITHDSDSSRGGYTLSALSTVAINMDVCFNLSVTLPCLVPNFPSLSNRSTGDHSDLSPVLSCTCAVA
eukprot:1139498-Pelagomonas_calceolata.AAC.3